MLQGFGLQTLHLIQLNQYLKRRSAFFNASLDAVNHIPFERDTPLQQRSESSPTEPNQAVSIFLHDINISMEAPSFLQPMSFQL
ncbi:hypothetical protein NDK43_00015 [Neobacillus pocheonensis]|uniref:Uncharacterized protein n=1 Tax=Neobacillus pocheonensis TaxID=363869 RepID=A0ABT0W456_9BACI|nr:hypothetical protein [Neobacillus pocheonensis]